MKSFLIIACVFGLCCAVLAEDEELREKRSSSRSSERQPGGFYNSFPRPYPYPYFPPYQPLPQPLPQQPLPPTNNALLSLLPFILAQLASNTPAPAPAPLRPRHRPRPQPQPLHQPLHLPQLLLPLVADNCLNDLILLFLEQEPELELELELELEPELVQGQGPGPVPEQGCCLPAVLRLMARASSSPGPGPIPGPGPLPCFDPGPSNHSLNQTPSMTQTRLLVLLACFLTGTSGVPISPNAGLMESVAVGDMPGQGQIQSSPPGSEPHLHSLTNQWASQPNPNTGLSQLPVHFQYLTYPHAQQPQFFYYPVLGAQSRNPPFSYGVPAFQHATSQQYPANAGPASQPLMTQNKQHKPLNQPQQQQVPQFLYMVPQMQQRMAGPYGGLSSEELQNMGRMHMPALRGNVFPVAGPQPVVPISPLRPTNTFHPSTFQATSEVQLPSAVAVPAGGDAVAATGGSHTNSGALPGRIPKVQDRERVPCDHVLPAEDPLTNTGPLDSDHGPFISANVPTVQPDLHHGDATFPTPENKDPLLPLRSDTVNTNADMYP
ncbi:ameloblastin [Puntigrus tetrazona]|uniref:ameloblastin n=1 Tax=Puntigrus tetrazona TaxID=1606681 RepID=UPI001C8A3EE8|nr:ameloblastin [Puntigrus tetrazona]